MEPDSYNVPIEIIRKQLKGQLDRVPVAIAELERDLAQTDTDLKTAVQAQIESSKVSLELLEKAQQMMNDATSELSKVSSLCHDLEFEEAQDQLFAEEIALSYYLATETNRLFSSIVHVPSTIKECSRLLHTGEVSVREINDKIVDLLNTRTESYQKLAEIPELAETSQFELLKSFFDPIEGLRSSLANQLTQEIPRRILNDAANRNTAAIDDFSRLIIESQMGLGQTSHWPQIVKCVVKIAVPERIGAVSSQFKGGRGDLTDWLDALLELISTDLRMVTDVIAKPLDAPVPEGELKVKYPDAPTLHHIFPIRHVFAAAYHLRLESLLSGELDAATMTSQVSLIHLLVFSKAYMDQLALLGMGWYVKQGQTREQALSLDVLSSPIDTSAKDTGVSVFDLSEALDTCFAIFEAQVSARLRRTAVKLLQDYPGTTKNARCGSDGKRLTTTPSDLFTILEQEMSLMGGASMYGASRVSWIVWKAVHTQTVWFIEQLIELVNAQPGDTLAQLCGDVDSDAIEDPPTALACTWARLVINNFLPIANDVASITALSSKLHDSMTSAAMPLSGTPAIALSQEQLQELRSWKGVRGRLLTRLSKKCSGRLAFLLLETHSPAFEDLFREDHIPGLWEDLLEDVGEALHEITPKTSTSISRGLISELMSRIPSIQLHCLLTRYPRKQQVLGGVLSGVLGGSSDSPVTSNVGFGDHEEFLPRWERDKTDIIGFLKTIGRASHAEKRGQLFDAIHTVVVSDDPTVDPLLSVFPDSHAVSCRAVLDLRTEEAAVLELCLESAKFQETTDALHYNPLDRAVLL
eukprot:gnl/Dysnectes_brevis/6579_a10324_366.p1 GENE.gnl/Dysnectes_brevis/6579_a10324_366~~gnl/Dysnectes_brevis/6579_a10324_366.p1  ORF type:complete len:809 (+),score=96.59 gnl/Dysnectes_brevis/6579_a10324_366:89-2515(+)